MAEKNKNQTAAERAALAEALSGKACTKCGQVIKIKDLVHVKQVSYSSKGKNGQAPYHRLCYTF